MKKINFKRAIAFMLAMALCIPALATLAFASEDTSAETPYITEEPTTYNPTVEVSHPDGASYQWYNVVTEYEEITEEMPETVYGTYDSELGWKAGSYYYPYIYFACDFSAGDEICLPIEAESFGVYGLYLSGYDRIDFVADGDYIVGKVVRDGVYNLHGYEFERYTKIYLATDSLVPIADETGKTLSDFEIGKAYTVVVTFADGTQMQSEILEMEYDILTQPSQAFPTIEPTITRGASYQWYEGEIEYTLVDDTRATPAGEGLYSDGKWDSVTVDDGRKYLTIDVEAGTLISVKHNGNIGDGDMMFAEVYDDELNMRFYGELNGGNRIEFLIEDAGTYALLANPMIEVGKLEVSTVIYKNWTAIEGEIGATLKNSKPNHAYRVEVKYDDGAELVSDAFAAHYKITAYPTTANPSISTNGDSSASYKWYKANGDGSVYTIVSEADGYYLTVYDATFEGETWGNTDGYMNIAVEGFIGDVIKVKIPDGVEAAVQLYAADYGFETEDGKTFSHVIEEEKFVDFEVVRDDGEALSGVEVWIERGENIMPVIASADVDEEAGKIYATYSIGNERDGKWTASNTNYAYVEFTVINEGTKLIIGGTEGVLYELDKIGAETEELTVGGEYDLEPGFYYLEMTLDSEEDYGEAALKYGGKTYILSKKSPWDDKAKTYTVDDIDNGNYADGKWIPDEDGEIDIELSLDKGTTLTIAITGEFKGKIEFDTNKGSMFYDVVDGKCVFTADTDYNLDLEMRGEDNNYSAVITLEKGTASEVAGATTKNAPKAPGSYYAVVNFIDGTSERTPNVLVYECEHSFGEWQTTKAATTSETGEEARSCTICGESETRATDKLDGKGKNAVVIIIVCSSVAVAGGGLGAYFFIRKKKLGSFE